MSKLERRLGQRLGDVCNSFVFCNWSYGGVILHLIANKYDKKAEVSEIEQPETLSNKHGLVLSLVAIVVLAIIMGFVASVQNLSKASEANKICNKVVRVRPIYRADQNQVKVDKVILEITKKGFHEADYMSGDYQDKITMDLKFTNKTDKNIRGVRECLHFMIFLTIKLRQ